MVLDSSSSVLSHRLQNVALLVLSLAFLPLDSFIVILSYIFGSRVFSAVKVRRANCRYGPSFRQKTVLITGVGMTKGLALARSFYEAGHIVIGADFEPNFALVCGRVSRSLTVFYPLEKPNSRQGSSPYIQSLLNIILKHKVDLWVSCSGVASAVEDGEAKEVIELRTKCRAVQFDVKTTQTLHEKDSFIQHTGSIGLPIPETIPVTSRKAVEDALRIAPRGRHYIMKTIGMDDSVRADMTLLPRPVQTETSAYIAKRKISEKSPWILQQYIQGQEFCTHAVVVRGQVKVFVACPSAELLMHYEALPSKSALSQAMLKFTKQYAVMEGEKFTGHLSFDFMVQGTALQDASKIVLYPIECNPRAHTAVALFNGTPSMVDGYLALLKKPNQQNGAVARETTIRPFRADKYYWIGHDLVTRVILPSLLFVLMQLSLRELLNKYKEFLVHLLTWKDGTYEVWDPLPWWWLYHVYWPTRFVHCIIYGKKWSRLNVSTTKMFEC